MKVSGGASGGATFGISTDFTFSGTQLIAQGQASALVGGGTFAGGGPTFGISSTEGPLPVGVSTGLAPHMEFNVGLPGVASGSLSTDYDWNGNITGGQFFLRGPNFGPGGLMAAGGVQATATLASPTLGQLWERIKRQLQRVRMPVTSVQLGVCWP
jgi:hypothetical protein